MGELQILALNINSLISLEKKNAIMDVLEEHKPHILLINETHWNNNHKFFAPGYNVIRNDKGQGTAILVQGNIKYHELVGLADAYETTGVVSTAIKIEGSEFLTDGEINNREFVIAAIYFPNNLTSNGIEGFLSLVNSLHNERTSVIVGGDFNARHTKWGDSVINSNGRRIGNWFDEEDFEASLSIVAPNIPTFPRGGSFLDFFLVSSGHFSEEFEGYRCNTFATRSDHLGIKFMLDLGVFRVNLRRPTEFWSFKYTDWEKFREELERKIELIPVNVERNLTISQIDDIITEVTNAVWNTARTSGRLIKTGRDRVSQLPADVRALIDIKRGWYRDLHRVWQRNLNVRNPIYCDIKNRIRLLEKIIDEKIKNNKNDEFQARLRKIRPGPNAFKEIRKIIGKNTNKIGKVSVDGIDCLSTEDKIRAFEVYYGGLYDDRVPNNDTTFSNEVINEVNQLLAAEGLEFPRTDVGVFRALTNFSADNRANAPEDTDIFVTEAEVADHVIRLNNKRSAGFDNVSNYLLRKSVVAIANVLAVVYNNCINIGHFPRMWKIGKLLPFPKSRDSRDVSTFRPIALLSNFGKLFEKIIDYQLERVIRDRNVIPSGQFGFRGGHSTIHALLKIHDDITQGLRNKRCTVACSLDIQKAFDSVWIDGLLYKMIKLGFPNPWIRVLSSFLSGRAFVVDIDASLSSEIRVARGVPQGSVLGPKLYSIFLADLEHELTTSTNIMSRAVLYADDTLLYATADRPNEALGAVAEHYDKVKRLYNKWGITINEAKTNIICFRCASSRAPRGIVSESKNMQLDFISANVRASERIKYLGIILHHRFKVNYHAKYAMEKAVKARRMLSPLLQMGNLLSVDTKLLIYKQLIRPVLTYGFPCWLQVSPSIAKKIAIFERKILRTCVNKKFKLRNRYFSNNDIYKEVDLNSKKKFVPIIEFMCRNMDRFLNGFADHDNRLIREIYINNINEPVLSSYYLSPISTLHQESRPLFQPLAEWGLPSFYDKVSPTNYRG